MASCCGTSRCVRFTTQQCHCWASCCRNSVCPICSVLSTVQYISDAAFDMLSQHTAMLTFHSLPTSLAVPLCHHVHMAWCHRNICCQPAACRWQLISSCQGLCRTVLCQNELGRLLLHSWVTCMYNEADFDSHLLITLQFGRCLYRAVE